MSPTSNGDDFFCRVDDDFDSVDVDFLAVDFLAVGFLAVDFLAAVDVGFLAVDFRALDDAAFVDFDDDFEGLVFFAGIPLRRDGDEVIVPRAL